MKSFKTFAFGFAFGVAATFAAFAFSSTFRGFVRFEQPAVQGTATDLVPAATTTLTHTASTSTTATATPASRQTATTDSTLTTQGTTSWTPTSHLS